MKFQLIPVLSDIEKLYRMPIGPDRFKAYIQILNGGDKNKLAMPVGGYNPMAKQSVLDKLLKIKALGAESFVEKALLEINEKLKPSKKLIRVGLNLADDIGGSWSNKFQTSFDSIFKFNGVFNYDFCAPYLWMTEEITEELIYERTKAYAWRTVFWVQNGKPKTLEDHLNQEIFVCENLQGKKVENSDKLKPLQQFYEAHKNADDYSLLFNFFYGDEASKDLNFPTFGIGKITGFDLAKVDNS